jgi:TolB-like protein/Flp pilus assembly protein TadD
LFTELKRRNVLRMAALYIVAAWLVMQVAGVLIDLGALPEWSGLWVLTVLAIGFPIALISSWFFELTPEGVALEKEIAADDVVAHTSSRRMDFVIIAMLSAAVIMFAHDKWWPKGRMEQSIAVLPFENLSGDPGQEYFSDGISEEILNLLAQIKPLKVLARTSSFSFKGKDVDIATIAAQLNVQHVLEGSVRRSGDRIRITAQLIDASDSTHVWSQTYDRELDDIFTVQDDIATAISESLKLQLELAGGEPGFPLAIKAANADAYDAYLKGRELFRRRGNDNVEAAIREFELALRLDDKFAPAHAQLAVATAFLGMQGELSLEEVTRIAIPHLERAEALAPNLAEVYAGRALVAFVRSDFDAQVEHTRKALELNPNYGDAMNWLQVALGMLGRYEEMDALYEQILAIDPLDRVVRANYVEWLCQTGRIDEARTFADQVLAQGPRWGHWIHASISLFYEGKFADGLEHALQVPHRWWASWTLSRVNEYDEARRMSPAMSHWVNASQGEWDETIRASQERLKAAPGHVGNLVLAGGMLFQSGQYREALPLLERAFARAPEGRPIPDLNVGRVRATIWLAEARRQAGDEAGAQVAAQIARRELAARKASGRDYAHLRHNEAMLAAFENDLEGVVKSLRKAVQLGLRDPGVNYFGPASFARINDEPRVVELLEELDALVVEEHDKVLQLICFNNPAPDDWQPLPETCDGVVEQRSH